MNALADHLIAEWDTEKTGFGPDSVTGSSNKKVWWLCEEDHSYLASVNHRNRGSGCPYCGGQQVLEGFNDLATVRPDLAREWDKERNGFGPDSVTGSSNKKVWWRCKKDHSWQALVSSRNRGSGCPYCAGKKVLTGFNDLATLNPPLVKEWNTEKNEFGPDSVTAMSKKKVWWVCSDNPQHEWSATVANRSQGSGCPHCRPGFSKAETALFEILLGTYQDAVQSDRKIMSGMELDIWIPSLRVGIEFNGNYWHDETRTDHNRIGKRIRERHDEKEKRADAANVRLLVVWESDWTDNPERVIEDVLTLIVSDETPPVTYTFARNRKLQKQ